MASAGVVGMAEVVVPNSGTSAKTLGTNVMWSYVWVGAAVLFLMFVHVSMMGRG